MEVDAFFRKSLIYVKVILFNCFSFFHAFWRINGVLGICADPYRPQICADHWFFIYFQIDFEITILRGPFIRVYRKPYGRTLTWWKWWYYNMMDNFLAFLLQWAYNLSNMIHKKKIVINSWFSPCLLQKGKSIQTHW